MSWAEFVLRSIGFKRVREYEYNLVKMQAYETHKVQYIFSGKRPPSFDKFWLLKKKSRVTDEARLAFEIAQKKAQEQIKAKKNG